MNVNLTNIYKNKQLKKGLEFAANNGTLFAAGTSLALSAFVRPVSIMLAPDTDKNNKKFAASKSIASSAAGYLVMMGASVPIAKSAQKIDNEPAKYLAAKTINNLTEKGKSLVNSKSYQFIMQMFKLGAGAVAAVPKSILTCLLIPPIMKSVFKNAGNNQNSKQKNGFEQKKDCVLLKHTPKNSLSGKINFTSLPKTDFIAKGMGKIADTRFAQNAAAKYKDSNFAMHAMAATDTVTTLTFAQQTKASKKIDESRKNPLIYNAVISTGLSIAGAYALDKALDKPTEKFIENFSNANKESPKLGKYIEGIKIAKPTIILGGIYYGVIPFISTYLADRADCLHNKHISQS